MNKKFEEPKFEKTEFEAVAYLKGGSNSNSNSNSNGDNNGRSNGKNGKHDKNKCKDTITFMPPM